MSQRSPWVRNLKELPTYSPPHHDDTTNTRIVGPGGFDGKQMGVVHGSVAKGGIAHFHFHNHSEQVVYCLSGRGKQRVGDDTVEIGPGDVVFMPPGVPHALEVLSDDPIQLLIVYAPPLQSGDWNLPESESKEEAIRE